MLLQQRRRRQFDRQPQPFPQLRRFDLAHRRMRILSIDDDPHIHTILQIRLRRFAVDLEQAYFGSDGVVKALAFQPDIIVTDIAMPNGDGHSAIESLSHHPATANVPIIVLSAMRDRRIIDRIMRSGVAAFIQKPARFNTLVDEIARHIELVEL